MTAISPRAKSLWAPAWDIRRDLFGACRPHPEGRRVCPQRPGAGKPAALQVRTEHLIPGVGQIGLRAVSALSGSRRDIQIAACQILSLSERGSWIMSRAYSPDPGDHRYPSAEGHGQAALR